MRSIQPPLLQNAHQAAGQNIHRETAGDREIMKMPAMVTGMIFIIICCCGSVEVIGVIFETKYMESHMTIGKT